MTGAEYIAEFEPKLEMGRPINDQYPYLSSHEYEDGNLFVAYERPLGSELNHSP